MTSPIRTHKSILALFVVGLFCVGLGLLLLILHPHDMFRISIMTFSEGGMIFECWRNPAEIEIILKTFAFNITNADAFLEGTEKLKLQEVGPFVYREISIQLDTKFNHENGTVSSSPRYRLEWVPELNIYKEDEVLVLPNLAMLIMASKLVSYPFSKISLIPFNTFISQTDSHPIIRQTWREFAFGFETPFVTIGNKLLPNWINFEKVGVLDRIYDFSGDISTTYTGETDYHLTGLTASYNGLSYLPQWSEPCNKVVGSTNGQKIGNSILSNETVYFYRKPVCRALPFTPVGSSTSFHGGIPTELYKIEEDALDNGVRNPKNKCFCKNDECLPRGLFDVSDCFYSFPIAISYPHFYDSDPSISEPLEGLKPDKKLHESYLYLSQESGVLTSASLKLQLNAVLGNLNGVLHSDRFANMVLPLAWIKLEMATLPTLRKFYLFLLIRVLPVAEIVFALLLLVVGVFLIARAWRNNSCSYSSCFQPLLKEDESEQHANSRDPSDEDLMLEQSDSKLIRQLS